MDSKTLRKLFLLPVDEDKEIDEKEEIEKEYRIHRVPKKDDLDEMA